MKKILALAVLGAFSMVSFAATQGDAPKKDEKKSEEQKKEHKKKKKDGK